MLNSTGKAHDILTRLSEIRLDVGQDDEGVHASPTEQS